MGKNIINGFNCGRGSIIFHDIGIVDGGDSLTLGNRRTRLCKISIAPNDFYRNKKFYNELLKDGADLAPYEDYNWSNSRNYVGFVHMGTWEPETGLDLAAVVLKGSIHRTKDGVLILDVKDATPWEAYNTPTKAKAKEVAQALEELDRETRKLVGSVRSLPDKMQHTKKSSSADSKPIHPDAIEQKEKDLYF